MAEGFATDGRLGPAERAECLGCVDHLCDGLPGGERTPAQKFTVLERGDRLPQVAGRCAKFWVVTEGAIAVCTGLSDGRRQIVSLAMAGEIVCAMAAFEDAESWVEAMTHSKICEIDLHGTNVTPEAGGRFMAMAFRHTHRLMESLATRVVALGRLDGMERLCLFLADITRRRGVADKGGHRVSLPMSREDIADLLGLNAETVSRLLSKIKKMNLVIFLSPTEFVVPDIKALDRRVPLTDPSATRWRAQHLHGEKT